MLRGITKITASSKTGCGKLRNIFQKRWLATGSSDDKIEVEVKFPFSKTEEDKIQAISKLISIKRFTDQYFDNDSYTLTSKDIWLRQRDNRWECKTTTLDFEPRSNSSDNVKSLGDRYHEIEKEGDIIDYLRGCRFLRAENAGNSDLHQMLLHNGYTSFCNIETTRKKYQYRDLIIDLDMTGVSNR